MGDQLPKGIEAIAASARPESLSPRPRAKPPATIQITLQLIDCRSFAVITPVSANTPNGIMATVLESMPVTLSSTQNKTVTINVTATTTVRQLCFTSPSM